MQNKRKVWWKWLLYPLTIIIGILLLVIPPILFLISLGIDCDFMFGDLLLHLFCLPFERKKMTKKNNIKNYFNNQQQHYRKKKNIYYQKRNKFNKNKFLK
ncbi:hypothetical protein D6D54_02315 [Spiroplasma poulsonii]|uniref:Transmembrane protein n=1 Tax=Spiroplasma poulsonii TaxID=2138 RepID=A0A3S0SLS1_9MOLU|nr:hypothetical protein [Spiroplasma sp. hyd1]RUP77432.1 hypothetical protein D6D54_02315 [Spiroplasma poulsonii]